MIIDDISIADRYDIEHVINIATFTICTRVIVVSMLSFKRYSIIFHYSLRIIIHFFYDDGGSIIY